MTREEFLEQSFLTVEEVQNNPEVGKALKQVGWTNQDTTLGKKLYGTASAALAQQKEQQSLKVAATVEVKQAEELLQTTYKRHLQLARLAVPDDRGLQYVLGMNGPRKTKRSARFEQIRVFYQHIDKIADTIAGYGVTAEELTQAKAMVDAVVAARVKQNNTNAAAQQARFHREQAYQELTQWRRKFIRTARFAFQDDPQQLEAFGVKVK